MPWRPHLPDNCPPDDAIPTNGTFYRLIKKVQPQYGDFMSYRELYPNRAYEEPECIVCGVSVYSELAGISKLISRTPGLKKSKRLAKGQLDESYGEIKNTPSSIHSSHHSWWIPDGVDPSGVFKVVDFPEDEL